MKSVNNKVVPIPPYNDKGLEDICHAELVSASYSIEIPYGETLTPTLSHRRGSNNGFTLAEVLIALVVIGIIAAITMTTVMPNIRERINSQRQANIVYKVTQATDLMKANGAMVDGFASTDAFVDELQKYLKIMKRCDSEHIADCWPTKTVTDANGDKYEVKNAKKRGDLGFKENSNITNVGIVLNDGASLIMTYDPTNKGMAVGALSTARVKELPVGGKYQTFPEYTTDTTAGLAFVMDVNGAKGPNSETIDTKMYDIRNLNGARFKGCGGQKIDGTCFQKIESYSGLDCSIDSNGKVIIKENEKYCGTRPGKTFTANGDFSNLDMWAGGMKSCMDLGLKVPSQDEMISICQNYKNTLGINKGLYMTSTENTGTHAWEYGTISSIDFSNCTLYTPISSKSYMKHGLLCVDD